MHRLRKRGTLDVGCDLVGPSEPIFPEVAIQVPGLPGDSDDAGDPGERSPARSWNSSVVI